jgi:transcriptional regulator with XRE-family HTH domain
MWTNSFSMEQMGEFLQEVRQEQGILQSELAQSLGISHTTLSNLERGKSVSTATLQRVVQALGLRFVLVPRMAGVAVEENPQ